MFVAEITCCGRESDESAVGRSRRLPAVVVALVPVRVNGRTGGSLFDRVPNINMGESIAAAAANVRRIRLERDEPSILRDSGKGAVSIALLPVVVDADADCLASLQIVPVDVQVSIVAAVRQIRSRRVEYDKPAIGGNRSIETIAVSLVPIGPDGNTADFIAAAIMHEDMVETVVARVSAQVGGRGIEGDPSSIGRDRGSIAVLIRLVTVGIHGDAFCRAGRSVMDINLVESVVALISRQIGRLRGKRNKSSIR